MTHKEYINRRDKIAIHDPQIAKLIDKLVIDVASIETEHEVECDLRVSGSKWDCTCVADRGEIHEMTIVNMVENNEVAQKEMMGERSR